MSEFKVKELKKSGGGFKQYRALCYGDLSIGKILLAEWLFLTIGWLPGALGLGLRKLFYPLLFKNIGSKVIFGRNVVIRHPHKITIGHGVIIDDHAVIDAKGEHNRGIIIGDGVYVGRNTIIYCKNGNIEIGARVNIASNCQLYSSNELRIGEGCVIAAFSYLMSGGAYDYTNPAPFADQNGMETKGPCVVGADCWIGAGVHILDGVTIGDRCVIAAGAVANKDLPARSVCGGLPAHVIKQI